MVVEARYRAMRKFVYYEGVIDFSKGLSVCYDNSSFIAMISHSRKIGSIHVYVEHEVDTPNVVDDTMLLPTSREREVNIRVGKPNCNDELSFNERVNDGAGEPFTELSGEFNMGPELGESIDACAKSGESSKSSGTIDADNLLGSEGVLGAESEDEEKKNQREGANKINSEGPNVGEGSEKGEKNGEVSDPLCGGNDYVDSSNLGSYRSDSDGEKLAKEELKVNLSRGHVAGLGDGHWRRSMERDIGPIYQPMCQTMRNTSGSQKPKASITIQP
ncbi:hypothetical protein GOBAR_DD23613 [Gossypium barbadense]|nr:hypothetical protein GOBAR_DD23613 [Gossypium barbadense]